jgi:acetyl esterase/lipase
MMPATAQQPRPTRPPEGTRAERDIEYVKDGHERNKLDLYLPEKADGPLPVIVWIHGGAWRAGSKDGCLAAPLATKGYVVASINYRYLQQADFPAQIEDCKAAIRWLRANAKKYNIDPDHIGVIGGSAGGHLAALLGTSGDVKELEGTGGNADQSSRVQAVVDLYGATAIPAQNPGSKSSNVLSYITKDDPPFLILHGDADKSIPIARAEGLTEALKKADVEVTFVAMKGAAHADPVFRNEESMKTYQEFFDKHLKKTPPKKD